MNEDGGRGASQSPAGVARCIAIRGPWYDLTLMNAKEGCANGPLQLSVAGAVVSKFSRFGNELSVSRHHHLQYRAAFFCAHSLSHPHSTNFSSLPPLPSYLLTFPPPPHPFLNLLLPLLLSCPLPSFPTPLTHFPPNPFLPPRILPSPYVASIVLISSLSPPLSPSLLSLIAPLTPSPTPPLSPPPSYSSLFFFPSPITSCTYPPSRSHFLHSPLFPTPFLYRPPPTPPLVPSSLPRRVHLPTKNGQQVVRPLHNQTLDRGPANGWPCPWKSASPFEKGRNRSPRALRRLPSPNRPGDAGCRRD